MGIKGLWKELDGCCTVTHLSQCRGLTFGVDAFSWLHRAGTASATPLGLQIPDDKYLAFFASRLDLLKHYGITAVLVFDGRSIPMKANTNKDRQERRVAARQEALQLNATGQTDKAQVLFQQALEVPPEMALTAIRLARERNISCIISPYESDAQLSYLYAHGFIHGGISEDSDLLVFGLGVLVAKLDSGGRCEVVRQRDVLRARSFVGMDHEMLIIACILSGCDYSASLPGVGMKKAIKVVRTHKTLCASLDALKELCVGVPFDEYCERVHKAFYCFRHHLVYDPTERKVVPLHPFPENIGLNEGIVGRMFDDRTAKEICEWHLRNPQTGELFPKALLSSEQQQQQQQQQESSSSTAPCNLGDASSSNNRQPSSWELYSKSLEMYWRRIRGAGQQTITTFFPKPTVEYPKQARINSNNGSGGGSEPQFMSRAVDRPGTAGRAATSAVGNSNGVSSKYFVRGAAPPTKSSGSGSSSSSGNNENIGTAAPTPQLPPPGEEQEPQQVSSASSGAAEAAEAEAAVKQDQSEEPSEKENNNHTRAPLLGEPETSSSSQDAVSSSSSSSLSSSSSASSSPHLPPPTTTTTAATIAPKQQHQQQPQPSQSQREQMLKNMFAKFASSASVTPLRREREHDEEGRSDEERSGAVRRWRGDDGDEGDEDRRRRNDNKNASSASSSPMRSESSPSSSSTSTSKSEHHHPLTRHLIPLSKPRMGLSKPSGAALALQKQQQKAVVTTAAVVGTHASGAGDNRNNTCSTTSAAAAAAPQQQQQQPEDRSMKFSTLLAQLKRSS